MTGACDTTLLNRNAEQPPILKQKVGPGLSVERDAVFSLLKQLAIDNEVHFQQCNPTMYTTRIAECCHEILLSMDIVKDLVKQLQESALKFDYDENTPGNGFRSLVCVSDVVILRLISVLRTCSENRTSMMFRATHYCKEIESSGAILRFLTLAFHQVISMLTMLDKDSLFPSLTSEYEQYNGILKGIESLDATCFYGRLLGFQFAPSVTRIFRVIGIVLATYSLTWESGSAAFGSLINSGKMLLNPEQRAVRIIKVTREADIEFCRGFWNLSELPMPKFFCPAMALCESREIAPSGSMLIESSDGGMISIPEPSAHTGVRPILMKILSVSHRIGISSEAIADRLPLSSCLVIHCHGGGYVATTSKSHETYLRGWAKSLNCPIVSIDYSLAPENPFPRATEEVLYAYAWILNNPQQLGWTGEKVCMVGDSAGGNLIVSVNLRLIELKAKRLPDGIVPIYTPFLFQYLPSPSRVLSFMDPLLHMGVVIRCAAAYTGSYSDEELDKNCSFHDKTTSPTKHKSLTEYVDEMQKAHRDNILDLNQGSQSIVSLINMSQNNRALKEVSGEVEEDILNDSNHTVHVDDDPLNICLSSTNFDQYLIDYLQMHPITKRSVHRSAADAFKDEDDDYDLDQEISGEENSFDSCVTPPRHTPQRRTSQRSTPQRSTPQRNRSQSFSDTVALAAGHAYDNISDWLDDTPKTPVGHVDKRKLKRAVTMSAQRTAEIQLEEAAKHESHFTELLKLKLPRDYLMSPLYAPDELLQKLPPVRFVACHLDPLLDDTIMFAKRMRNAGGQVRSIDLLDSLPHGFLNFTPMSADCREGANLCLKRIKETFDIDD